MDENEARVQEYRRKVAEAEAFGEEIARISANVDAAMQRMLFCIRKFDESGEYYRQGSFTCAHWLSWRIGLTDNVARERVRVARALGKLDKMDESLSRGELSYSKVRAMTRVATPENEDQLLHMAKYMTGNQLEELCRKLRRIDCHVEGTRDSLDQYRFVSEDQLPCGLVKITMVLHPDEAAMVMKAVDKAREESPRVPTTAGAETRTYVSAETGADVSAQAPVAVSAETPLPRPQKPRMISRVDAVMKIAESFLATGEKRSNSAERYQVFLHLAQDPFGKTGELAACLDDGTRVSAETLKRITCDCCFVPAADDENGNLMNLGRRRRTINPALRRALRRRDGGCRFPGCTNRLFVSGHHIKHWLEGGETSLANTCFLCAAHHKLLHEGLFTMEGDPNGELIFRHRNGWVIENVPEREPGSYAAMIEDNREQEIDEETTWCGWDGEKVQWEYCVGSFYTERHDLV